MCHVEESPNRQLDSYKLGAHVRWKMIGCGMGTETGKEKTKQEETTRNKMSVLTYHKIC